MKDSKTFNAQLSTSNGQGIFGPCVGQVLRSVLNVECFPMTNS